MGYSRLFRGRRGGGEKGEGREGGRIGAVDDSKCVGIIITVAGGIYVHRSGPYGVALSEHTSPMFPTRRVVGGVHVAGYGSYRKEIVNGGGDGHAGLYRRGKVEW